MGKTKYLLMTGFWFFGVFYNYIELACHYIDGKLRLKNESTKNYLEIMAILTGLTLGVPFQIAFTSLATPFILTSYIHHQFYELFLAFFGIGNRN